MTSKNHMRTIQDRRYEDEDGNKQQLPLYMWKRCGEKSGTSSGAATNFPEGSIRKTTQHTSFRTMLCNTSVMSHPAPENEVCHHTPILAEFGVTNQCYVINLQTSDEEAFYKFLFHRHAHSGM